MARNDLVDNVIEPALLSLQSTGWGYYYWHLSVIA